MLNVTTPPKGYTIKMLTPVHLPDLLALQDIIVSALPEDGKDFISVKSAQKLEERMTTLGIMHGAFTQTNGAEKLVAYGGVVFPTASWPTADLALEHGKTVSYHHDELAVIQSCAVHPEHRGKGLHKHLIAAKEEVCLQKGRIHIMSEVAAANPASLKGFLAHGYKVVFAGIAPGDQCPLLFVHKDISNGSARQQHAADSFSIDPVDFFALTKEHLERGCKGIGMHRNGGAKGYVLNLSTPVCV